MKKVFFASVAALLLVLPLAAPAAAQDFPRPSGFVMDEAGLLSPQTAADLEGRLRTLEAETSSEIAVVTVDTLGEYTIEEFSVALFESWGIGKSDKDNGVLFLVALAERDVRIEVGYGLEGVLTDGRAGRILDGDVVPYLRNNDFDGGISAGVARIEEYIREGTPPGPLEENPVQRLVHGFRLPMALLIVLGIVTLYMVGFMARTKSAWLGGIWGVLVGAVLGLGWGSLLRVMLLGVGLGLFGLILDLILSASYRGRSSWGLPTNWTSSRGGFSGPWGGTHSSGSFGGFGGGHSGGGGASRGF